MGYVVYNPALNKYFSFPDEWVTDKAAATVFRTMRRAERVKTILVGFENDVTVREAF